MKQEAFGPEPTWHERLTLAEERTAIGFGEFVQPEVVSCLRPIPSLELIRVRNGLAVDPAVPRHMQRQRGIIVLCDCESSQPPI